MRGELAVLASRLYESGLTRTVRDGEVVRDPENGDVRVGRYIGQAALVWEVGESRRSWKEKRSASERERLDL